MTTAIVLGAAVWPGAVPSPTLARRTAHAVHLFHTGEVQRLCLTGGLGQHPPTEAQAAADLARAADVPDSALILEDRSTNTHANIANALALLPASEPIMLVSDSYHLPRAWLIARALGRRVTLSACARGTAPLPKYLWMWAREALATPLSLWRAFSSRP